MFKRVLIANRGEIAIRIARAASALGIESVGVYAPTDALSLHTRVTTKAVALGADAALAASIFHYDEFSIPITKQYLAERGVAIRLPPRSPVVRP